MKQYNLTPPPGTGQLVADPATDLQKGFINDLLRDRKVSEETTAAIQRELAAGLTKRKASGLIDTLKELPWKPRSGSVSADPNRASVTYEELELDEGETRRVGRVNVPGVGAVLAGRYAIDTADLDNFVNNVTFFQLKVGTRGGWWLYVQRSDDDRHELSSWPTKREIIGRIAQDPEAAMRRWGHEFERCGLCGRGLTNDLSRELGIGPVCRTRL